MAWQTSKASRLDCLIAFDNKHDFFTTQFDLLGQLLTTVCFDEAKLLKGMLVFGPKAPRVLRVT